MSQDALGHISCGVWACVGYRRKSKMGTFSAIYVIEPNVKIQKLRVFYHDGEPSRGSDEARKKQGNIFHTQFWTLHRDKIEAGWSKLKEAIERRDLEQRKTDQDSTNKRKRKEYKGRGGNKRNGNKKPKASNLEAELPTEAHAKEKADKAGSGTNSPTPETEAHTREKAGSGMALDTHPQPQPQHGGSNEGEGNQAGSSAQDTRMALSNILGNYEA
ncbi:hypothetical protein BDP27DRAFT_1362494 [Rhodocollybia butyracea]|uniref:Uncharacterized protein n=1 Tax=Rhodocollybia butyracea TaxID=206335 RepID=A0A9P5U863_9AGAR|nr:hypothetical protein BDP27DRAFT_1362494 [Rhodocollybia butyracea]